MRSLRAWNIRFTVDTGCEMPVSHEPLDGEQSECVAMSISSRISQQTRQARPYDYAWGMCRNIKQLHNFEPPATEDEVRASALQYVRKVSGSTKPSQANAEAFERAVEEVAATTANLLDALVTSAPPKNREVEAAKRRARAEARFAAA